MADGTGERSSDLLSQVRFLEHPSDTVGFTTITLHIPRGNVGPRTISLGNEIAAKRILILYLSSAAATLEGLGEWELARGVSAVVREFIRCGGERWQR